MTKTDNQTQTVGELRRVLESIAYGYDSPLDGRDAVMMRNDALAALSALPERGERISADGSDDDWPRALARLKATEPHPDQGIACVGTGDLAMALDRLQQFADVALGNAVEINRLMAASPSAPEVPVKGDKNPFEQPCYECGSTDIYGPICRTCNPGLLSSAGNVERLVKAALPFSRLAKYFDDPSWSDTDPISVECQTWVVDDSAVTVGDLRALDASIAPFAPMGGEQVSEGER